MQSQSSSMSKQISYRELNSRANQLAHHLQSPGVREESLVGILVERSVEMLVGILGVLKAGAAYVPLDPSYPQERLSFMVADAGVEVLLTQQHLAERFASASLEARPFANSLSGPRLAADRGACDGQSGAPFGSGQRGVCHLHVRLDRQAEGRRGPTCGRA